MTDPCVWRGLHPDVLRSMAALYGEAEAQATRRISVRGRAGRQAAAEEVVNMRRNLRAALADELRELGCPDSEIEAAVSAVIMMSLRLRREPDDAKGSPTLFAAE